MASSPYLPAAIYILSPSPSRGGPSSPSAQIPEGGRDQSKYPLRVPLLARHHCIFWLNSLSLCETMQHCQVKLFSCKATRQHSEMPTFLILLLQLIWVCVIKLANANTAQEINFYYSQVVRCGDSYSGKHPHIHRREFVGKDDNPNQA